jgi:lipoate-protein ligase B
MIVIDLGNVPYLEALDLQRRTQAARIEGQVADTLLLVEHPPVFTLGRRGNTGNICVASEVLERRGADCVHVERGGDVTFHGPGQLVGYPICAIGGKGSGVAAFVDRIEKVLLGTVAAFGIDGVTNPLNRGAWVGEEKIGFIGISVKKGVSLHGFALNVHTDLSWYDLIHSCGLAGVGITSMAAVQPPGPSMDAVKKATADRMGIVFQQEMIPMTPEAHEDLLPASPANPVSDDGKETLQ